MADDAKALQKRNLMSILNVKYTWPKFIVIVVIFLGAVIYFISTNKALQVIDIIILSVLLSLIILFITGSRNSETKNKRID